MVHYIRFLRTPHTDLRKKTVEIAAVVAITTDLGDALYAQDVDVLVEAVDADHPHGVRWSQVFPWHATSRALKFALASPGNYAATRVRLHVTTVATKAAWNALEVPSIVDVWSLPFTLSDQQRTDPLVERRLWLPNRTAVSMWEETGESIARHIWDASLGFLLYFATALSRAPPAGVSQLAALVRSSQVRRTKVLELGAGCGVVGIAWAQLVRSDVLLTDLDDAQMVLARNMACAAPVAGATLRSQVWDWATGGEDRSTGQFDLILVSDCIYNPDSSGHLVETLQQLAAGSPTALVLVGFKRRHDADAVFFDRMRHTSFDLVETFNIPLPHDLTDQDTEAPVGEFYTYKLRPATATNPPP